MNDWRTNEKLNSALERRALFLIKEARIGGDYDRGVAMMLRHLSNYCSAGRDGGSRAVRKYLPMSKKARALLEVLNGDEWHRRVQNEHPEPLRTVWKWMADTRDVSSEQLFARLCKYRMAIVTREEHVALHRHSSTQPGQRYLVAKIELCEPPTQGWKWKD